MSGREWKPGDVAAVNDTTRPDVPWKPATCIRSAEPGIREAEWLLHESAGRVWDSVSKARPLVVIDPEDTGGVAIEIAQRVCSALNVMPGRVITDAIEAVQAVLREVATPTPPRCSAHVNLAGKDFQCVEPPQHGGGHRSPDAWAVWGEGA